MRSQGVRRFESIRGMRAVYRVSGVGLRVSGFGFRVSGVGFQVSGFGFQGSGANGYLEEAVAFWGEHEGWKVGI